MRLINADALHIQIELAPYYVCESGRKKQYGTKMNKTVRFNPGDTLLLYEDVSNFILDAPTIAAEPVRHGRWEWYEDWGPSTWLEPPDLNKTGWKCSNCGIDLGDYLTDCLGVNVYVDEEDKIPKIKSCPHCGAKMDMKEENI